ncbi:hypothetical protein HK099_000796 [Clydaea vesicula]|uniref:Uncharacterized protein n=1 Tax=Clydaea vesicula TaxID=447962 RepID=A0AAD5U7W0_9FUNG|nr:hypothetical protein HK099_000796 [Clydaea vesicula]
MINSTERSRLIESLLNKDDGSSNFNHEDLPNPSSRYNSNQDVSLKNSLSFSTSPSMKSVNIPEFVKEAPVEMQRSIKIQPKTPEKNSIYAETKTPERVSTYTETNTPKKDMVSTQTTLNTSTDFTQTAKETKSNLPLRKPTESTKMNIEQKDILEYIKRIRDLELENKSLSAKNDSLQRENSLLQDKALNTVNSVAHKYQSSFADIKELNEKINVLIRENDILLEQNKQLQSEVAVLEDEKNKQTQEVLNYEEKYIETKNEIRNLELEIKQQHIKNDLNEKVFRTQTRTNEEMSLDFVNLEEELQRYKSESRQQAMKIAEMKRSLEEVSSRYQTHVTESKQLVLREQELMETLKLTESELNVKYDIQKKESESLSLKQEDYSKLTKSLELIIKEFKDKEAELHEKVQSNIEKAEEANLEKERCTLREEQTLKEVERLQNKVADIQNKYKLKADTEISSLRNHFNAEKKRLNEEISILESSRAHMQNQMERAIREKRSTENELEKLTKHIPLETERLSQVLDDLTTRLRKALQEKFECQQKLETFQSKCIREQNKLEREKAQILNYKEDDYKKLRKFETLVENLKEEKIKYLENFSELDHKLKRLTEYNEKLKAEKENELNLIRSKYEYQVTDLTAKLEQVSESNSKSCNEMQRLLSEQRQLSEKWKFESKSIQENYELILKDIKQKNYELSVKIEEKEENLLKLNLNANFLKQEFDKEKLFNKKNLNLIKVFEEKLILKDGFLKESINRENEILNEKKCLEKELDKALLEKEKLEKLKIFKLKYNNINSTDNYSPKVKFNHVNVDKSSNEKNLKQVSELLAEISRVKERSRTRKNPNENYKISEFSNSDGDEESEDE